MKQHYVYKITRGDYFYIGLHSTLNLEDGYFGSGKLIKLSVKKHGKDAHTKEILQIFETREEADAYEILLLSPEVLQNPFCLNLKPGGQKSAITDEIRAKIAARRLGTKASDETKAKMSQTRRGKPKSENHKLAIAKSHAGKAGIPHTAESKLKIALSSTGRIPSTDTRDKIRNAQIGKPRDKLTCPHCQKTGGNSNMRRYHFDACKLKT